MYSPAILDPLFSNQSDMQRYVRLLLFTTVFTTGAAVLIMEVAAVRMLAPYFGSSLYVLSSVLTVVLFALALGYYGGGRLSDRYPYHIPLYAVITLGGFTLLALTLCALYIMPQSAPYLPLLVGPLFFSIFFFFVPALLLGIDSPYVIKLLSREADADETGQVVGSTFFWSTAGSITGSLASGFILIPAFGLTMTMIGTGLVLVVLGIGGGLLVRELLRKSPKYDKRNDMSLTNAVCAALVALAIIAFFFSRHEAQAGLVYFDDGFYSQLKVFDGEYNGRLTRFLKQDSNNSSAIYIDSDELVYPYAQFAMFYPELIGHPKNFLMLASGAYTIPRAIHLAEPEADVDVVDIEPGLYELAVKYFRLPTSPKIKDHVIDARAFLNRNDTKYDYIFVDTFNSGHFVPPHLVTREFFTELNEHLTDDGIVVMNFIGAQGGTSTRTLSGSFTKTVADVFSNFSIHTTRTVYLEQPQNLMYIMRKSDKSLALSASTSISTPEGVIPLTALTVDPKALISRHDIVFTDDHAPVETLLLKERFKY